MHVAPLTLCLFSFIPLAVAGPILQSPRYPKPHFEDSQSPTGKLVEGRSSPRLHERGTSSTEASAGGFSRQNSGDPFAFSTDEITGIATSPWTPWRLGKPQGQVPLDQLKANEIDELWQEALDKGRLVQDFYEKYAYKGISRLDDIPLQPRPPDMERFYKVNIRQDVPLQTEQFQINQPFAEIGVTIDADIGFDSVEVNPFAKATADDDNDNALLEVSINVEKGILITLQAFAEQDETDPQNKLKSSELTWQSWLEVHARRAASSKTLKYWHQHFIVNVETENIMNLAHDNFPGNVINVPRGTRGPLPVRYGHGIWKPSTNPNDRAGQIFTRLLSTPNVKPIAHMLADHNDELDSPVILEIHTLPAIGLDFSVPRGIQRRTSLIVVLGTRDELGGAAPQGTVATS